MKKENLSITKARIFIQHLVKELLELFLYCKSLVEERQRLVSGLKTIDEANPDYQEILHDQRENGKMNFRFLVLSLSFIVDFLLLNTAVAILCDQFGWPLILKYVVPAILILLEVVISYFSLVQARSDERMSRLARNLQYLVLPILAGFALLAIFYNAQIYNEEIDGVSLLSYMTFTVVIQVILLISSFMLHLWLIRNSEEIAEAIAYMKYRMIRGKIVSMIDKIDRLNTSTHIPHFTRLSHEYVRQTDSFRTQHPDNHDDFSSAMPQELIDGVNKVMGRRVIASTTDNLTKTK